MINLQFVVANILHLYQDDNTPFVSGHRLEDVLDSLENASLKLFGWFSNNEMKTNLDKCHLPTTATASIAIKIKDNEVLKSESEKLLRVTIDNKLSFKIIYKKYLKKLIRKFMF